MVYFFSTKSRLIFSLSVSFSLVSLSVLFSSLLMTALRCSCRRRYHVDVLIMSLFLSSLLSRARFRGEKKNLDRLEAAVRPPPPEEEERRRNKRRFAFWVRVCRIKILSLREKERRRERVITALSSRTRRRNFITFLF